MKKKYRHIFFDLDDTLWDFRKNADEALILLHEKYKLAVHNVSPDQLCFTFHEINEDLWHKYSLNLIDREYLRSTRFKEIFDKLKADIGEEAYRFGKDYLELCPKSTNLIEGTKELLDYLKEKYTLHIITNGFDQIADIKLKSTALIDYFDVIVTSETTKAKKPAREIFEYALEVSGADVDESIMIGNDLHSDINGAAQVGMDQIYFNPRCKSDNFSPTYEVSTLREIREIL